MSGWILVMSLASYTGVSVSTVVVRDELSCKRAGLAFVKGHGGYSRDSRTPHAAFTCTEAK